MLRISPASLCQIVANIFLRSGAPASHADRVAQHLVEANLMGHDSHGVLRTKQYCDAIMNGELDPNAKPRILHDRVSGAVLDGERGFGQVAAFEATKLAIEKAHKSSVGVTTLCNCYHTGRLGAYAQFAAQEGCVGIVMVNAGGGGQSVVPFGGIERRLATNPFAISTPSAGNFQPTIDVATSMAPEGKVRDYHRRGKSLPAGWIVDSQGRPTTDSNHFYADPPGALLPWGGSVGYKGFGLAFMVDILAGILSGAGCCRSENLPARDGLLVIAIDVKQFAALEHFGNQVADLINYIKSSKPISEEQEIYVPGELEYHELMFRSKHGIEIDDSTWCELEDLTDRLNLGQELRALAEISPKETKPSLPATSAVDSVLT